MFKSCLKSLTLVFLFSVFVNVAFAGNNVLTKIGSMDLGGSAYSEWWYTQENPSLTGVAAANATVEIDVDGTKSNVTADASGNWSFAPTTLTSGDHTITITTGGEVYTFTLHAGQTLPEDVSSGGSGDADGVPATGYNQIYGGFLGLVLFSAGYALLKSGSVAKLFEKRILRDFD